MFAKKHLQVKSEKFGFQDLSQFMKQEETKWSLKKFTPESVAMQSPRSFPSYFTLTLTSPAQDKTTRNLAADVTCWTTALLTFW